MTDVRELPAPPSLPALYPRAIAGSARPALRRLPGVGRRGGARDGRLPEARLAVPELRIDRSHLAAYDRVCGFRLRDELPPTYLHVLAFPLSMKLMTSRDFPFPIVGLVHVRNRVEQSRPVRVEERPAMRVWTDDLRPHDRGMQFDVVAEASVDGETPWRSRSTYLRRGGGGSGGDRRERSLPPEPSAVWTLRGDTGRRYASVSGDVNPIHMHALGGRLFGLPGAIAHGMWLKARCLAALEGPLPEALAADVSFKLPVVLPTKLAFASWRHGAGRAFALHSFRSGKPHLAGSAEPLGAAGRGNAA
jgi:hypothetical protein